METRKREEYLLETCIHKDRYEDYDTGEITCRNCGIVLQERGISRKAEWRSYDPEQKAKRSRVGIPIKYKLPDRGLTTKICDYDVHHLQTKAKTHEERQNLFRLRRWQKRVYTSLERHLVQALRDIDVYGTTLNLPSSVVEHAGVMYRKIAENGYMRGRSIQTSVPAIVYAACRIAKVPRSVKEVAAVRGLGVKSVTKNYRFFMKKLQPQLPVQDARDFVAQYANKLELPGTTEYIALQIVDAAKKIGLTEGKGPMGIAAASLYIAAVLTNPDPTKNAIATQKQIAGISGVTEVTVRNRCRELMEKLYIEVSL